MEPIILELEREQNDLLIIAHESVLRVLYGYLMACDAMNIPTLKFPRNEIIEVFVISPPLIPVYLLIHSLLLPPFLNYPHSNNLSLPQIIPASYQNEAKRIHIEGLAPEIIPGSPEDIRIPVPPSGIQSPFSGIGTPALGGGSGVATPSLGEKVEAGSEKLKVLNPLAQD